MLLTYKGQNIAVVEVESKWVPNKVLETRLCYGTASLEHPGTLMVATERGKYYLGGKVIGLELPKRWVERGRRRMKGVVCHWCCQHNDAGASNRRQQQLQVPAGIRQCWSIAAYCKQLYEDLYCWCVDYLFAQQVKSRASNPIVGLVFRYTVCMSRNTWMVTC